MSILFWTKPRIPFQTWLISRTKILLKNGSTGNKSFKVKLSPQILARIWQHYSTSAIALILCSILLVCIPTLIMISCVPFNSVTYPTIFFIYSWYIQSKCLQVFYWKLAPYTLEQVIILLQRGFPMALFIGFNSVRKKPFPQSFRQ